MRTPRTALLTALLASVAVTGVSAQAGPRGSGLGFGMRSWALYENGVDSIAAVIDLTAEQRTQLDELVQRFHSDNSDAIERMNQMRAEIDELWTDVQRPRRAAMDSIAQQYGYPERDLRPAITQLHNDLAGIITVRQQTELQRSRSLAGRSRWSTVGRANPSGQRGYAARRWGARPQFGMRSRGAGRGMGRVGQMQRLRLHRRPPIDP